MRTTERLRCARLRRSRAFTLVEIMVVVIVLAILAATIIPQFRTTAYDAKVAQAKNHISVLEGALERFYLHMDRYPTTEEGLQALVKAPSEGAKNWRGEYVKEILPDPWGNPYMYRSPGVHGSKTYDLWSRGADGADGGEDKAADVTNWRKDS